MLFWSHNTSLNKPLTAPQPLLCPCDVPRPLDDATKHGSLLWLYHWSYKHWKHSMLFWSHNTSLTKPLTAPQPLLCPCDVPRPLDDGTKHGSLLWLYHWSYKHWKHSMLFWSHNTSLTKPLTAPQPLLCPCDVPRPLDDGTKHGSLLWLYHWSYKHWKHSMLFWSHNTSLTKPLTAPQPLLCPCDVPRPLDDGTKHGSLLWLYHWSYKHWKHSMLFWSHNTSLTKPLTAPQPLLCPCDVPRPLGDATKHGSLLWLYHWSYKHWKHSMLFWSHNTSLTKPLTAPQPLLCPCDVPRPLGDATKHGSLLWLYHWSYKHWKHSMLFWFHNTSLTKPLTAPQPLLCPCDVPRPLDDGTKHGSLLWLYHWSYKHWKHSMLFWSHNTSLTKPLTAPQPLLCPCDVPRPLGDATKHGSLLWLYHWSYKHWKHSMLFWSHNTSLTKPLTAPQPLLCPCDVPRPLDDATKHGSLLWFYHWSYKHWKHSMLFWSHNTSLTKPLTAPQPLLCPCDVPRPLDDATKHGSLLWLYHWSYKHWKHSMLFWSHTTSLTKPLTAPQPLLCPCDVPRPLDDATKHGSLLWLYHWSYKHWKHSMLFWSHTTSLTKPLTAPQPLLCPCDVPRPLGVNAWWCACKCLLLDG